MDLFGAPEAPVQETDLTIDTSAPFLESAEEEFDHPRLRAHIEGHEDIQQALTDMVKSERMHHGLIFAGPKGIGKATLAFALARYLFKYGNAQGDPNQNAMFDDAPILPGTLAMSKDERAFSLVASGGHSDLLTIERAYDATKDKTAASVAVADIRRVNPFLRMTSSDGGWRVVIIDDADTMNRAAQNALLKILEEPPKKTLLILVTHRLGALIPTIRSRTQTINIKTPQRPTFEALLRSYDPAIDPTRIDTLYHLSKGSFGSALNSIENDALETFDDILEHLKTAPNWDWPAIHKLSVTLSKGGKGSKDSAYKNFTHLLLWVIREMVTAKARGQNLSCAALAHPSIENWMRQSSLEKLLENCDKLDNHFMKIDRANLDKKQAVLHAFSILAA